MNRLEWTPGLVQRFGPAVAQTPWGWGTPFEVLGGSDAYELRDRGAHVLLAVRPVPREQGLRLDLAGLVSEGDRVRAAAIGQALDELAGAYGARGVAMATQVPHVARTAVRCGFRACGVMMIRTGLQ
jgi:hypothetical protein